MKFLFLEWIKEMIIQLVWILVKHYKNMNFIAEENENIHIKGAYKIRGRWRIKIQFFKTKWEYLFGFILYDELIHLLGI